MVISAQSNFTEQDAKQLVDTFFEGFHKGDTVMMRSVLAPSVRLQTAATDKNGAAQLSDDSILNLLNAIANRPADQNWEEFWFNGNFSHCGANAFTIAKTEAGWKIIHLIDSRRREGCREWFFLRK